MHRAITRAYDQRRLGPGFLAHPFRQIGSAIHGKQTEQGTFSFAQHHRPPADDREAGIARGSLDAFMLFIWRDREDARENASLPDMPGRYGTVIRNVTTHFKTA